VQSIYSIYILIIRRDLIKSRDSRDQAVYICKYIYVFIYLKITKSPILLYIYTNTYFNSSGLFVLYVFARLWFGL